MFLLSPEPPTTLWSAPLALLTPIPLPSAVARRSISLTITVSFQPPRSRPYLQPALTRSEERRVGKECRYRCPAEHHKKNTHRHEQPCDTQNIVWRHRC